MARKLNNRYSIAVITNDIYTKEDARILISSEALPEERIIGVETGGCPHTAIREDASMNFEAIEELEKRFENLDIIFIESGGDNLAAAFSPELVDRFIYIIDVAQGEKIPRKGGPGIMRSDMLIINKIDLAPYVGASLEVMDSDTKKMRGDRPYIFSNLMGGTGLDDIVTWVETGVQPCLSVTGEIKAEFAVRSGLTQLVHKYHASPLKIAKTFRYENETLIQDAHPADQLGVYMMDCSPGLMSGDHYEINVRLGEGARVFLTNQSFTKVHPSEAGHGSTQRQTLHLEADALLEYIPEPLMLYKDASLVRRNGCSFITGVCIDFLGYYVVRDERSEAKYFSTPVI